MVRLVFDLANFGLPDSGTLRLLVKTVFRAYVPTSSSPTKPQDRDFDALFPSMMVKRSPAVYMFTCSCVFIIELIVFCCSS